MMRKRPPTKMMPVLYSKPACFSEKTDSFLLIERVDAGKVIYKR
jgi:hypothetical protein